MPAIPTTSAPSTSVACLRTPCSKSAYGRSSRSAIDARDRLDLGVQRLVDDQLTARGTRHQLDRAVVVRRPEPARDAAEIGLEPLAQRRLELGRVVADDRDPRRLEAEPQQLRGEERAVQVAPVAADELTAGDDDEAARAAQAAARVKPCVVKTYEPGRGTWTTRPL